LQSSGKIQFFGTAVDNSSILVLTGTRHEIPKNQAEIEKEIRFIIYTMERGRKEGYFLLTSTLKDKVTVIFDRMGMKTDKSDAKIISQVIPILQKHYPERLSRLYLFPTSSIFWMAWNMSKFFLDPVTIPKLFLKESPVALAEWVDRAQYFTKYGGSAQDPFDIDGKGKQFNEENSSVLKTAPMIEDRNKFAVQAEEFWAAPIEYQNI
jgi:hypothetical protein